MHSFASVLIAAALAALSSAAPAGLPAPLPTGLPSAPLPTGTIPSAGQLNSVEAIPSIALIFNNILTEIQPYTEQLTYMVPSNCTITQITTIVASIKAPIVAAIPQLEALVGQEASAILAPVAGGAELTVSEVATIVGGDVSLVLVAAGNVLDVTNAQGGDIVADAKDVLTDLGSTVTSLVGAAVPLVNGLPASLAPEMAPVDPVVSALSLGGLAIMIGLNI